MSDIRNVHVLCSRPFECDEAMGQASREMRLELPALLSKGCGIPQPYVEVCNCGAGRDDIHVHVTGLNTICTAAEQPRRDAIKLIESTVRRYAGEFAVLVIDDDDIDDRRIQPHLIPRQHGAQPLLL